VKARTLVTTLILISLSQMSATAEAFAFGNNRMGSTFFRGLQSQGLGPKTATGGFAFNNSQRNHPGYIGAAPPIHPNTEMPPAGPETYGRPQAGADQGQPGFGQGMTTSVIRVQSIANVRLRFSLIAPNGSPCITRSINPDQAISLPVCGDKIHWHDGTTYEDISVQAMRVYRFLWSGSKWAVEDVTAELN
jgi:hypothetical protein